jgi:hypothetical protein
MVAGVIHTLTSTLWFLHHSNFHIDLCLKVFSGSENKGKKIIIATGNKGNQK